MLSECIADLKSDFEDNQQPLTDDNQQLQRFCAKLEYLLRADMKGVERSSLFLIITRRLFMQTKVYNKVLFLFLQDKYTILGKKKDYWDYICDCLGSTKGINDGIKYVKTLGDVSTQT